MTSRPNLLPETPSQTAGPYVQIGCLPDLAGLGRFYDQQVGERAASPEAKGTAITLTGRIEDGEGAPVTDAMIETWQSDAAGLFAGEPGADPAVAGLARFSPDAQTGVYRLETIKPGARALPDGRRQAPHLSLLIMARGINVPLHTRVYFEDEDNAGDPLLDRVHPPERAETMIARREADGSYRLDIKLQGDGETVFLDI